MIAVPETVGSLPGSENLMFVANLGKPGVLASVLAFLLLTGSLLAQSPAPPFGWGGTAVPDTIGPPIGFGDVDGDGSPDLIVIAAGGAPHVLRNDGHGWFAAATAFLGTGGVATAAIVDFNADGKADVATLAPGTSGSVSVWFGAAPGVLAFAYTLPVADAASVAAGDVNGDGAPDLVFAALHIVPPPCGQICQFPAASVVLLNANDGSGNLVPAGSLGLPNLGNDRIVLADVDQDGDQDLVTLSNSTGVGLVWNIGGTFGAWINGFAGTGSAPVGIRIARLNADAYPDIVAAGLGSPSLLYLGGPGGLTQWGPGVPGNVVAAVEPLDLNLDGIDEVVAAGTSSTVVYSVGMAGALTPMATLQRVGGSMFVQDVDGDGDRDFVIHETATQINTEYLSDGTGGLHEQGPPYARRYLSGGPVPLDWNGDGAPDLVGTISDSPNKIAMATNDGVGRFSWTTVVPAGQPLSNGQRQLVAADLDADGDKDLVAIEKFPTSNFAIRTIMNGGGGTWTATSQAIISSGSVFDVAAADMNGDGTDDIVFCDPGHGVQIMYGYSGWPIIPGTVITTAPATRLALADMDLDGDVDIVVAHQPEGSYLLLNQGNGTFVPDPAFPIQPAIFCTVADVTGDGYPDCWLNNQLFLQNGGSWTLYGAVPTGLFLGGTYAEVRSFDFDGDGDFDTVSAAGLAYVNQGGPATTFTLPVGSASGQRLVAVDLDRDGDLDLLTSQPITFPFGNIASDFAASVLFNTARQLTLDAPARPGHVTHMGIRGAPGGLWFLFASTGLASIAAPPFGTILIDPASALQIGAGTLDSQGKADWSALLPPSFSIYAGVEFDDQAFVDTVAGPRITNARRVVISSY